MITVILVAHIMVSIVLIIVVLMQRSEGGALGIGGGGGGAGGGLMTSSGVKGALVRTTIIFGAIFFVTSLGLTTLATQNDRGGITEIEENLENEFGGDTGEDALGVGTLDALDELRTGGSELSDDPLAISPSPSIETAPIEDTNSDQPVDPLADPQ